jgi:hypothetical protein
MININDSFLHDPFPTPFTDEVLENVGGQEAYSFTNVFSSYHQIKIAPKDMYKTTFVIQVDIDGHPPFPTGSKHLSGNFGNLLFLASFNFRGHFEGLNEGFWRSRFSMIDKGMIEPPKGISLMIPFQRAIIHLKRRSYAKVTTPGS